MAGGGSDKEQNYWPGFVDALSNVVLTLVFVLVVFVFALTMMTNKASMAVEQIVKARVEEERAKMGVGKSTATSDSTNLDENAAGIELKVQTDEKKQVNRGAVQLKSTANEILVTYPRSVLDLDEVSMTGLRQTLEAHRERLQSSRVHIESYLGPEPYSLAQRLAYYRSIRIRNMLIQENYAKAESISSKILPSDAGGLGHVRIIITQ